MFFDDDEKKPEVISTRNIALAFGLHVVAFLVIWLFSIIHFKPKETIIPIDLVFEAPPDEVAPEPEPPKPEPKPVVKPPEPPPVVEEKVDAVVKIKDEKKPEKKKPEPPKEKPKPPEPKPEKPKEPPKPEKTKEQIKKEKEEAKKKRIEAMRNGAKVVKNPKPPPVAGTGQKLDPNWKKLLGQGYEPSDHTELAASEEQRCVSLIKNALDARWNQLSPQIGQPGTVVLEVSITADGRLVNCHIAESCGDPISDKAALDVARTTGRVVGMTPKFIRTYPTLTITYKVKAQ